MRGSTQLFLCLIAVCLCFDLILLFPMEGWTLCPESSDMWQKTVLSKGCFRYALTIASFLIRKLWLTPGKQWMQPLKLNPPNLLKKRRERAALRWRRNRMGRPLSPHKFIKRAFKKKRGRNQPFFPPLTNKEVLEFLVILVLEYMKTTWVYITSFTLWKFSESS